MDIEVPPGAKVGFPCRTKRCGAIHDSLYATFELDLSRELVTVQPFEEHRVEKSCRYTNSQRGGENGPPAGHYVAIQRISFDWLIDDKRQQVHPFGMGDQPSPRDMTDEQRRAADLLEAVRGFAAACSVLFTSWNAVHSKYSLLELLETSRPAVAEPVRGVFRPALIQPNFPYAVSVTFSRTARRAAFLIPSERLDLRVHLLGTYWQSLRT